MAEAAVATPTRPCVATGLDSWHDTRTRHVIEDFVNRVTSSRSPHFVPAEARVAVFDNDGTLWSEKPIPIEMGFLLQRLAAMASADASLRDRQPWRAAARKDYAWLGAALTKHYHGDDGDLEVFARGTRQAFEGMPIETYQAHVLEFLTHAPNPILRRRVRECGYLPMVELLRFLDAHEFVTYIVCGGEADFMRAATEDLFGVPADRVIGSSGALAYTTSVHGASIAHLGTPDLFDDGAAKPVRIWSRVGRRPILAVGNANSDIPMLQFAGGPSLQALRLVVRHDDGAREFDDMNGAETLLQLARASAWPVISMKNDWKSFFARRTLRPAVGAES